MISRKLVANLVTSGALAVSLLFSTPVWAQVAGATLSGTVTDASGAVIPQAKVSIKSEATGINNVVETNADGFYSVPNLLPGTYDMTASASGFAAAVHNGVTLTVGSQQVLNFSLRVGEVSESVQITAAAPAVELASSTISAVVTSTAVVDLPLNGRDWTTLATLQPAVNAILTQAPASAGAQRGNRGYGNALTISGTRPQLNNYRLDGISIVDYANGAPGSVVGIALGVDAIAEFSVLTSNSTAEYGRSSGGIINAITRSGANQIHGDAFWFLRDEGLDARSFFDVTRAPFHRNQFGTSLGGPIQKDKTFFFGAYEGLRQAKGITVVDNVPSADARKGIIHNNDGSTTNLIVDPLVVPFLALWPMPNAGLIGTGNTGHFNASLNNSSDDNFGTVRIDRRFSDKDSIFGTYFYDKGLTSQPDNLDDQLTGNQSIRQMIVVEETHVFSPALVNSLRVGYNRVAATTSASLEAINPLVNDPSLGSFPGRAAPQISVTGLAAFGGGVGGLSTAPHTWNSFQVYDDAFLTRGVHSLKMGFVFERMQHNFTANPRANGSFTFGSLTNFLTNHPLTFQGQVPGTSGSFETRQSLFGGYLQDDWRLRQNLTVNLGLRYEAVTVPKDVQNRQSNLPTFTSPTPQLGAPLFKNPTLRDLEPRIGFSWDPFRNGKTAIRGAFGIFDVLPLNYEFFNAEFNAAPFTLNLVGTGLSAGAFPTGAASTAVINSQKLLYASIQFDPPRNYVMIWNLNVQRQLAPSTTIMVGYVGNHGVHMLNRSDDVNMVIPASTPQGFLWPSPRGSGTILNPNVGALRGLYWGGDAVYDALELQVSKRIGHGFEAQGSYTWGKNIDTGSASILGDPFTNSISSLLWFCNSCRRGLSDFDIAQSLVVNYIWNVPAPKNWGAFASHVLGGWQVGGIITAQTGVPITPLIGGDPLGLKSTDPYAYPNRLTGCNPINKDFKSQGLAYVNINCFAPPNPLTLLGNVGRNTVIGPGLVTWDSSLFKNNYITKISDTFNAQFRVEFFNFLNRANFATPTANETFFDQSGNPVGGAGTVSQTSTQGRDIQIALKLIW